MKPPKKDDNTVRREVALYASMGGKSYRVATTDHVVHFLHLGQIEGYFKAEGKMPLLVNTKYDLFLTNNYYDIYCQDTGEHRDSTPDEALDIYIQEYIQTGFIRNDTIVKPD